MVSFDQFFPSGVHAFVSDRTVDFKSHPKTEGFTSQQKSYLQAHFPYSYQRLVNIHQVHGDFVWAIEKEDLDQLNGAQEADGVITHVVDVLIAVRTADCLSIFIYDPKRKCLGLVHAGWRGTHKQIIMKALQAMKEHWGCSLGDLLIAFGPCIRKCCYQVGGEFKDYFPQDIEKHAGKYYLDLLLVNKKQLIQQGVKSSAIYDCQICTCCDKRFFSFRREKEAAGRQISLMILKT